MTDETPEPHCDHCGRLERWDEKHEQWFCAPCGVLIDRGYEMGLERGRSEVFLSLGMVGVRSGRVRVFGSLLLDGRCPQQHDDDPDDPTKVLPGRALSREEVGELVRTAVGREDR